VAEVSYGSTDQVNVNSREIGDPAQQVVEMLEPAA
jgi:hypothetical protein